MRGTFTTTNYAILFKKGSFYGSIEKRLHPPFKHTAVAGSATYGIVSTIHSFFNGGLFIRLASPLPHKLITAMLPCAFSIASSSDR